MLRRIALLLAITTVLLASYEVYAQSENIVPQCTSSQLATLRQALLDVSNNLSDVDFSDIKEATLKIEELQQDWWNTTYPDISDCSLGIDAGMRYGHLLDEYLIATLLTIAPDKLGAELAQTHLQAAKTIEQEMVVMILEASATAVNSPATPVFANASAGESRSNPVPFGQRQHVEISKDFFGSIQLVEFLSGSDAQDYIQSVNRRNEDAPEGTQYLVYRMKYACEKSADESCDFSKVFFEVVGDKGITYDFTSDGDHDVSIRDIGDSQEIFGGAEIEVEVAFLVDADDANFILLTAKSSKPRVYFASQ